MLRRRRPCGAARPSGVRQEPTKARCGRWEALRSHKRCQDVQLARDVELKAQQRRSESSKPPKSHTHNPAHDEAAPGRPRPCLPDHCPCCSCVPRPPKLYALQQQKAVRGLVPAFCAVRLTGSTHMRSVQLTGAAPLQRAALKVSGLRPPQCSEAPRPLHSAGAACSMPIKHRPRRPRVSQAPAAARAARRTARVPPAAFFNRGSGAAAGGNDSIHTTEAHETMVPEGAIRTLSPDARRIFREVRAAAAGGGCSKLAGARQTAGDPAEGGAACCGLCRDVVVVNGGSARSQPNHQSFCAGRQRLARLVVVGGATIPEALSRCHSEALARPAHPLLLPPVPFNLAHRPAAGPG